MVETQRRPATTPPTIVDLYLVLRRRWLLVLGVFLVTVAAAVAAAYMLPPTFRSEVTMAPAEPLTRQAGSGPAGALGALKSLTGASSGNDITAEALAILESRRFTEDFIRRHSLTDTLLAEKKVDYSGPAGADRAVEDAVLIFSKRVRGVSVDSETGFVTLRVDWRSPELAQRWATWLVTDLDQEMKRRARDEAQRDLIFLQYRLRTEQIPEIRSSLIDLVRDRMEREMFASRPQFAFRVIDPPTRSFYRSQPQRTLIVAAGAIAGLLLGLALTAVVETIARIRQRG